MLRYHYREIVDVTFPGATCSSVFSPAAEREPQFDDLAHLCFSFCTCASPWGSLTQPQPLRSGPRPCLGKWCTPWGCSSGLLNTLHSGNAAGCATLCVCLCVYSCTSNLQEHLQHQLVMHHETVTLSCVGSVLSKESLLWIIFLLTHGLDETRNISQTTQSLYYECKHMWGRHRPDACGWRERIVKYLFFFF